MVSAHPPVAILVARIILKSKEVKAIRAVAVLFMVTWLYLDTCLIYPIQGILGNRMHMLIYHIYTSIMTKIGKIIKLKIRVYFVKLFSRFSIFKDSLSKGMNV